MRRDYPNTFRSRRGFSLVELSVALGIILVLGGLATFGTIMSYRQGAVRQIQADLRSIHHAQYMWLAEHPGETFEFMATGGVDPALAVDPAYTFGVATVDLRPYLEGVNTMNLLTRFADRNYRPPEIPGPNGGNGNYYFFRTPPVYISNSGRIIDMNAPPE